MINNKKLFKTAAVLAIALSLLAGCGNGNGKEAGNADASPNVTESATPDPGSAAGGEDADEPSGEAELQTSETPATEEPAQESEAPSATTKPSAEASATAKPTPKPTAKPTVKPSEKPSTKPTEKPSTSTPSQKPSPKPTVKPSEKPKPSQKPEASVNVKTSAIVDKIKEEVELPMLMSVSGEQVKDSYYFDPSELIAEGSYNQAMMNTKATELVVVKLTSDKHYDAVKEGLTKRAEDIIKTFSQYLPDQHEDAKNYQIVRQGNYVMLSISHDQEAIKKVFDSFFK